MLIDVHVFVIVQAIIVVLAYDTAAANLMMMKLMKLIMTMTMILILINMIMLMMMIGADVADNDFDDYDETRHVVYKKK